MEVFDVNKAHKCIKISNDGATVTKGEDGSFAGYELVYGSVGVDSKKEMKYQWKVTITKFRYNLIIGIGSIPDIDGNWRNIDYGYSCFNGYKESFGEHSEEYGVSLGTGDELIITVDFDMRQISFTANDVDQGVAFSNIVVGPVYYLVGSFYTDSESITINEFKCIA